MLRDRTRFLFMRPEMATAELQRLLPLLPSTGKGTAAATHSVASLIVSTAYSATAAQSVTHHSRDCPVLSKKLPLSRIGKEPSFAARPCLNCVRERVHYVSSLTFCESFEQRCALPQRHPNSPTGNGLFSVETFPKRLLEAIERSYGSVSSFRESVVLHSTGAMSLGRLWVVYIPPVRGSEHGAVSLLNLPACRVPLVHGLWPLAVINMTERRICEKIACRSGKGGDAVDAIDAPAWSHAARTPKALGALASEAEGSLHQGSMPQVRLSAIRSALAEETLSVMNWQFVETQLTSASAYYTSMERTQKQREHRKEKEHAAAVRAMGQLKDSGAVIHATDSVTITSSDASDASPANGSSLSAAAVTTSPSPANTDCRAHGEATPTENSAETVACTSSDSVQATGNTTTDAIDAEPRTVQQADGTWEYHYKNGSVTKVRPDGTKVFQTESLTTTVFVNGDTLFEYPNSTSILDRADGVRVTTYADGTQKEERLR
ncbi:hypothetical protein JKF63_01669 [Porcisia hertigi]|uniref:Centromere protein J C-terminal domain-containing protein n=1 Tax=Porcisia hertigi TaxID=2761500 RepID=A0A836L1J8_9TRYP|nr:hypothetical protein JKF63_01669 [Porcisia hertigi]